MKPEPPPYPRPVPSIDYDEDPILPNTIIYTQEDDVDQKERAAKRRRIESNANAYLRGEGLFILSAGLRGPFDTNWKNPWAVDKKKRKAEGQADDRSPKRVRVKRYDKERAQRAAASSVMSQQKEKAADQQENPFERRIRSSEPPTHDEKVELWLRRNDALPRESFVAPASPTPKKRASLIERADGTDRIWTPTKQRITLTSQDVNAPLHHVQSRIVDSFEDGFPSLQPLYPAETHAKLQDVLCVDGEAGDSRHKIDLTHEQHVQTTSSDNGLWQPVRAEEAIISMKRQFCEKVSPETPQDGANQDAERTAGQAASRVSTALMGPPEKITFKKHPDSMLPGDKYNMNTATERKDSSEHEDMQSLHGNPEIQPNNLEASVDVQFESLRKLEEEMPKGAGPSLTTGVAPPHSMAVSDGPSVKLLPSAQQKPELQTSTSNISSGALLPDISANSAGASDASSTKRVQSADDKDATIVFPMQSRVEQTPENKRLGGETSSPDKLANIVERENAEVSQALRASHSSNPGVETPKDIHVSPARPNVLDGRMSQTSLDMSFARSPPSVTRRPSRVKSKRASFGPNPVSHSSQGSIKNVLKVQKAELSGIHSKSMPDKSSARPSIDTNMSREAKASPRVLHSRRSPGDNIPKSILKQTSSHSTAAAALASAMLSPQNRQGSSLSKSSKQDFLSSRQNGVASHQLEEDFDIEGALDELGSFLSTWDAEKETIRIT